MQRDENKNDIDDESKSIKTSIAEVDVLLDDAEEASSLLGAGLGRRELEAVVDLLYSGLKPEAIAEAVLSVRREAEELVSKPKKPQLEQQQKQRQQQAQQLPPPLVSVPALSALSAPLSFPTSPN